MTLRRGAVLCWRLVQAVALITYCGCGVLRGRPGRPVDLVTGNFGDYGGLMDLNIRAIGRSDCTTLWDFDLIVRATEAVDRSDFSNVVWWLNWVYGYRQGVTC